MATLKSMCRLCSVVLIACQSPAVAGDRGTWFKSLQMPGSKASCCDLADCHATDAAWRSNQWWAVINDKWRPVPQAKVLAKPHSLDGSAYICTGSPSWAVGGSPEEPLIYCFVPPNWPA
jgi:hypothetical protein